MAGIIVMDENERTHMIDEIKIYCNNNGYGYVALDSDDEVKNVHNLLVHNIAGTPVTGVECLYYGSYYNALGNNSNTLKFYTMGSEMGDIDSIIGLYNYYLIIKDYDNMKKCCKQWIKNGNIHKKIQQTAFILGELGYYYDMIEQFDKAEKYYLQALEYNNQYHITIWNLGVLYFRTQNYKKMKYYFNQIILSGETNERFPYVLGQMGYYYHDVRKKYDKAEKYYLQALEHNDNDYSIMWNLGFLYHHIKNYKKMKYYCNQIILCGKTNEQFSHATGEMGYYYHINRLKYGVAEKFYLLAVETGNEISYKNLCALYNQTNNVIALIRLHHKYKKQTELVESLHKYLSNYDTTIADTVVENNPSNDISDMKEIFEIILSLDQNALELASPLIKIIHNLLKEKIDIIDLHFMYSVQGKGFDAAKSDFLDKIVPCK